jgi:hypothetical protein
LRKNNSENLEVGNIYKVTLTSGAIMMGVLFYKGETSLDNTVVNQYGISFDKNSYISLDDTQIAKMEEVKPIDTDYFTNLENEYDIRCFDNDGKLLPASRILYNVLSEKRIWDKMKKKERKKLIQHLYFTDKDILDMIKVFLMEKEENERLHNDKLKVLDATTELVDNYNKIIDKYSYSRIIHDFIFNKLGVEKFISQISK